jgi:hypothetical protein
MKIQNRIKNILLEFGKRLFYVNLIGFVIGIFIEGTEVFEYIFNYFLYSSIIGMTLWLGNEYFSIYVDRKYSWLEFPVRKLVLRLVFSLFYSTFIMVILYMFIWFFVYKKPDLTNFFYFNRISFLIFYAATLIVMLVFHSVSFFRAWQTAALNEEKLKKESVTLQLQALRSQVDPHFLFNSLNTLTSLIEKDSGKAITFVKQLSDMFRYMLDRDSKELVEIDAELQFVKAYTFLQQMRFGNNLTVNISVLNDDFYVLPISLQMLIENAIKHNEISEEFPLLVEISDEKDCVVVKNKIQPKMLETPSNGIGLQNLKIRYRFFTEDEIEIFTNDDDYVVKLPKLKLKGEVTFNYLKSDDFAFKI